MHEFVWFEILLLRQSVQFSRLRCNDHLFVLFLQLLLSFDLEILALETVTWLFCRHVFDTCWHHLGEFEQFDSPGITLTQTRESKFIAATPRGYDALSQVPALCVAH